MDPRPDTVRWIVRKYEIVEIDAEPFVDEAYDRVRANYPDAEGDEFQKLFRRAARNAARDFLRKRKGKPEELLLPPGYPLDRFLEFIFDLGPQSARELMNWHKGISPSESASIRGIQAESVKRERRRIVEKWKTFLQACPDLTKEEKRVLGPYLHGTPRLGEIQ